MTNTKFRVIFILLFLISISSFLSAQETEIKINDQIKLIKLNDFFYAHVTLFDLPDFGTFASNGLIFVKNGKAVLIDTPNDDTQTKQLLDYLKNDMNIQVEKTIVGHSHSDCMGGLAYIKSLKIESISSILTKDICLKNQLPNPSKTFAKKLDIDFYGEKIVCQYFGGGHTIDNIVVHFPEHKILFGGCLIRAAETRGLGNISEADIDHWDLTVKKIQGTYPPLDFIIPGHGNIGNQKLLAHTIKLVEDFKLKKN